TLALSAAWSKLQQSLGAAERVFELLENADRLPEPVAPVPLPDPRGALAFEGVSFAYAEKPVLDAVSLTLAPGEVVALVGPSGGGKTTLAHLALRLFDPQAGRVCLDGHDLRTLAARDLRAAIAYVSQEPVLFDATVYENVAFGDPHATPERVEAACRAANAHDFVSALPEGYETRLGERGASLSGGQRQRLAIARALLRDARVLVLDEATSALDNASEEAVREAIAHLMAGRTTLVIAHRMSAIERADRIVVLDGGRVVEEGTREALLRRDGLFRRLYEAGGPTREIAQ
ncbi:MAG TPA: ATP-binding cassette domain-containing protein, partial [Oscillatoriaceae cyanobacterium]